MKVFIPWKYGTKTPNSEVGVRVYSRRLDPSRHGVAVPELSARPVHVRRSELVAHGVWVDGGYLGKVFHGRMMVVHGRFMCIFLLLVLLIGELSIT